MTPTLQLFTRALLTPDLSFKTLADARAATGADGLPRLMRTTLSLIHISEPTRP